MLGDYQYCSSASENSDSDPDSDCSEKSDDNLDKLVAEKKMIEEKIQTYEKKLKYIQKTLRSLNDERNTLLSLRNKLISTTYLENDNDASMNENNETCNAEKSSSSSNMEIVEICSEVPSEPTVEPLNLKVSELINLSDVEEFDSDDNL